MSKENEGALVKAEPADLVALAVNTLGFMKKEASNSGKEFTDHQLSAVVNLVNFLNGA